MSTVWKERHKNANFKLECSSSAHTNDCYYGYQEHWNYVSLRTAGNIFENSSWEAESLPDIANWDELSFPQQLDAARRRKISLRIFKRFKRAHTYNQTKTSYQNGKKITEKKSTYSRRVPGVPGITIGCGTYTDYKEVISTQLAPVRNYDIMVSDHLPSGPQHAIYSAASMDYYKQVHDQRANLLLAMKEWQLTCDLITSNAKKMFRAAVALKSGKWKKTLKILGVKGKKPRSQRFSEQWLEYVYGWSPLVTEVSGAFAIINNSVPMYPIKSSRSKSFNFTDSNGFDWVLTKRCTMKCIAVPDPGSSARLLNRLSITNPALTIWESIPFSFLVDWVLPVGNWLQSIQPMIGVNLMDPNTTYGLKGKTLTVPDRTETTSWNSKYSGFTKNVTEQGGTGKVKFKHRRKTSPAPPYLFTKNPVSPGHALNAITLLTSIFSLK